MVGAGIRGWEGAGWVVMETFVGCDGVAVKGNIGNGAML